MREVDAPVRQASQTIAELRESLGKRGGVEKGKFKPKVWHGEKICVEKSPSRDAHPNQAHNTRPGERQSALKLHTVALLRRTGHSKSATKQVVASVWYFCLHTTRDPQAPASAISAP